MSTKSRDYLNLFNFITDSGDSISFRINPNEEITKELFLKFENAQNLSEKELNKYLKSELEDTVYINYQNKSSDFEEKELEKLEKNEKIQLLKKTAKIRECDVR